jgi:hypothetical protein
MLLRMEKRELWGVRVRDWRASGKSMSEFSRGKEFTVAGLSYWVKRFASDAAPSAKSLRLVRVVRTQRRSARAEPALPDTPRTVTAGPWLVIEAGDLRVHVTERLDGGRLEAVLIAVGRAAKVGGA